MKKLGKREDTELYFEPKEGSPTLLPSRISSIGDPSLDFNPNHPLVSMETAMDVLAEIFVGIYLYEQRQQNGTKAIEKGGDILPGFHEGAG
jgi:hypothetical protein